MHTNPSRLSNSAIAFALLLLVSVSGPTCTEGLGLGHLKPATHTAMARRYTGVTAHRDSTSALPVPVELPTIRTASSFKLDRVLQLRGGYLQALSKSIATLKSTLSTNPHTYFNACFAALFATSFLTRFVVPKLYRTSDKRSGTTEASKETKDPNVSSFQWRFLIVFWLLRMADWLQGPYFYEVYSSKVIAGKAVSLDLVSKLFLVGFATTGVFGPYLGKLVDTVGRKFGTLLYSALYALGALSTRSSSLSVLLLGRVFGGLGTSLLFCAPEAWMVGEHGAKGLDPKWLGETFAWAYAGDALVAIAAGQVASLAASRAGPSGPFTASIAFLALGAAIAAAKWDENTASSSSPGNNSKSEPDSANSSDNNLNTNNNAKSGIGAALQTMQADKRILLVGAMQALFEGAMYIFVLQWPPAIKVAVARAWGSASATASASVPYGAVFSCFMAACLLGSTAFGAALQRLNARPEQIATSLLVVATAGMALATQQIAANGGPSVALLSLAFFAFEACVGAYFPAIGTLRSKYLPDQQRSVIMNLVGVPLNLIVVSVFLSIKKLGVTGALACATSALAVATVCGISLQTMTSDNAKKAEAVVAP